ncbi:MAG: SRPBCC domain-containing protein [Dehalococcoidia bacterium]
MPSVPTCRKFGARPPLAFASSPRTLRRPTIEPIRLSFEVACPAAHAFAVWTAKTSHWWPRSHTVSGEAVRDVIFEPRRGGRIFERSADGSEVDWGEITRWEPPHRLGYLWHIRSDRADATDVEISFVDLGETTRVEIEHRGWERLGERGNAWRDANFGGWSGVLPHFIAACAD